MNNVIFRSDPDWVGTGHEWYDWVVARFPNTAAPTNRDVVPSQQYGTRGGEKCIARIMGFFRHDDSGCPTYNNVERMNLSWDEVRSSQRDGAMYMVLHCSALKFKYKNLVRNFIYKFEMTPLTEMYVLPVDCIVGPLVVIADIVSARVASNQKFMAVLPRHKQSGYWLNYIHSPDPQYEVEDDDTVSVSSDDTFDDNIDSDEEEDEDEDDVSLVANVEGDDEWLELEVDEDGLLDFS